MSVKFPSYIAPEQLRRESDAILEAKVNALLAAMTEEEKLNLCHGHANPEGMQIANAGYLPGVPRLGVPEIRMFDGPAGVTSVYETTGLPVQEMLAASWDPTLAYQYGKVEASENFAISGNTQLGSQYDLVRVPQFTRVKDMLGEDPFLTASMAVQETKGMQDQNVVATLKHFGVASIGTDMQNAADQIVDEQTLHEMYFPSFEAAAKEGGAGAFMCCYNKFNGAYASANEYTQKTVMREMWNYKGYMMSDWGANHGLTTGKGMDMEMPSGAYNSNERILRGIQRGRLTWDDVDTAVRHVLYGFGTAGYLSLVTLDENGRVLEEAGRTAPIAMKDRYAESTARGLLRDNAEICLEVARKGAVLLKNKNAALPLCPKDYTGENSVAMLGLGAVRLLSGAGQERSYGQISRMTAPADAVKAMAGESANIFSEIGMDFFGTTIPAECFWQDKACIQPGLVRSYGVSPENCEMPPMLAAILAANAEQTEKKKAPAAAGGGGVEFHGVASADEEEEEIPFMPPWTNSLAADMVDYETGSFCRVDETIDFTTGTQNYKNGPGGTAFPKGSAYTWDGYLTVPESGEYILILQAIGGNTKFSINLDGTKLTEVGATELREGAQWPWGSLVCTWEGMELHGGRAYLEQGRTYPIRVCVNATISQKDLQIRLAWIPPKKRQKDYQAALDVVKQARKVLFFLSDDYSYGAIGAPQFFSMAGLPSMEVPACQMQMLRDVKAVMRPDAQLIVLHNNGQLYALGEVEPLADAILNIWTPGQEGGTAVAELLLGKVNPSGKMALTIPAKDADTLVSDTPKHRETRYTSYQKNGQKYVDFDEGIFSGYRWYEKTGVKPLYAFGHGLSYTEFTYSDLSVSGRDVSFTVTNIGRVSGTEIAQIYLGAGTVPAGIQMAEKQLCGFTRLEDMAPGEKRTVTVTIPERSFMYWNPKLELVQRADGTKDKWVRTEGFRKIWVGTSSDRLTLEGEIQ